MQVWPFVTAHCFFQKQNLEVFRLLHNILQGVLVGARSIETGQRLGVEHNIP